MKSWTSAQLLPLLEDPAIPVYLVGAGGCGMCGLGHLLLDMGHPVAGSDLVLSQEVQNLRLRGAQIQIGHQGDQLLAAQPALVIYSSAIRQNNPELVIAEQRQIPIVRRAAVLAALVSRQRGLCVAGMHGKTTTSALLAFTLEQLQALPSYAVGATVPQLERPARYCAARPPGLAQRHPDEAADPRPFFVAEADESDGSFREFHPEHSILLNVDAEHLDYFVNLEAVCTEFQQFAQQTRGRIVYCADDPRLVQFMNQRPRAISYGFHPLAQYRAVSLAARRTEAEGRRSFTEGPDVV